MLLSAEADTDLHQRRTISGRLRRLLDLNAILPYASSDGAGLVLGRRF